MIEEKIIENYQNNGVALLNELNIDYKSIPYIIDDDKRKQGHYIPSTGQEVVSSESLKLKNINCIFIASQLHVKTIASKCYKQFGDKIKVYGIYEYCKKNDYFSWL